MGQDSGSSFSYHQQRIIRSGAGPVPPVQVSQKNTRAYPLRGKVFCGCCDHTMPRTSNKNHSFVCWHTRVDEAAACHGLTIRESKLEGLIYEVLSKQAQVILNLDGPSNAGRLDIQLAEKAESNNRIKDCMDQKRVLYERFVLKEIGVEDYKSQKAAIDIELDRLRAIHSALEAQTARMQMDEQTKSTRAKLAQEAAEARKLTTGLVDTLIDRVYVYPGNQVKIIWKMGDLHMESM